MSKKNRRNGRRSEYRVVQFWATLFKLIPFNNKNHSKFTISTTSASSTTDDGKKRDIWFRPTLPNWIRRFKIQSKHNTVRGINSKSIDISALDTIELDKDDDIPVCHYHVYTKPNKRQVLHGKYVLMYEENFKTIMQSYVRENERIQRNRQSESVVSKNVDK